VSGTGTPDICAVIVLYRERAQESRTVQTLQRTLSSDPWLAAHMLVCIYDNTPDPDPIPENLLAAETLVFQPGSNGGLPPAYNKALEVAEARGIGWLLLLDSDSEVTASFLSACIRQTQDLQNDPRIAAIVPHIVQGSTVHSPRRVQILRRKAIPLNNSGVFPGELIALNSGAALRTSAIRSLGAFTSEFWLDYLDYWLFRVLQKNGFRVFVLKEPLEHSLSLSSLGRQMSLDRYRNMLEAEQYFTTKYGTRWERVRLKFVLLKRAVTVTLSPLTRPFLRLTVASMLEGGREAPPRPRVQ
jgi:GT2 family glycosyltransferase